MARELADKRFAGLPGPAHVIYEPNPDDVDDERLRAFYTRWLDHGGVGAPGDGIEILDTPEAAPLARNLMLLEIIPQPPFGFDYLYRVFGAAIAEALGQDMTGRRTSEFPAGVADLFAELYETAINRRIVIHSIHVPPNATDTVATWERLILPIGEAEIQWLLVASIPKAKADEDA